MKTDVFEPGLMANAILVDSSCNYMGESQPAVGFFPYKQRPKLYKRVNILTQVNICHVIHNSFYNRLL